MNKQQTRILLTKILPRILVIGVVFIGLITIIVGKIWEKNNDNEVKSKNRYLNNLNKGVPPTISFSGHYDTLFLTISLESEAEETQTPYSVIEKSFNDGLTLNCTKVYYNWYLTESPILLENAISIGYKYFQAKVLYKDGTIENSTIIELD